MIRPFPGRQEWPPLKKGKGAHGGVVPRPSSAASAAAATGTATGEVRMATAAASAAAVRSLQGRTLGGGRINVVADKSSKDGTKLNVTGIPDGVEWQALKDLFLEAGEVKFAAVNKIQHIGSAGAGTCEGEVRFESADDLQAALSTIHGSTFAGSKITVKADSNSKDGTKCFIYGIPLGTQWQDLKDHCAEAGAVAFCAIKGETGSDLGEGEIRYDDPENAQKALSLDGSVLCGAHIKVVADPGRGDKLRVFGLPARCQWQELKDHFATIGQVAFSAVKPPELGGKGFGGGFGGFDMGKGCGGGFAGGNMGEVRFDDPSLVQDAVDALNGSDLGGSVITVRIDQTSKDGSKVIVTGIPPGLDWQQLKDHFASVGPVAFASVNKGGGKGCMVPGGGKGGLVPDPFSMMGGMMCAPNQGMKGVGGGMGMQNMMQNMMQSMGGKGQMMMMMQNMQNMMMMKGKGKGW